MINRCQLGGTIGQFAFTDKSYLKNRTIYEAGLYARYNMLIELDPSLKGKLKIDQRFLNLTKFKPIRHRGGELLLG